MPANHRYVSSSCLICSSFDERALEAAATSCRERIGGSPSLVIAFASSDYQQHLTQLIEILQIFGHASKIVGTSAASLYGVGSEHEEANGISLFFLRLPQVSVEVHFGRIGCEDSFLKTTNEVAGWVLLGNPLLTSLNDELRELNSKFPDATVAGGLIRGGPTEHDLFLFSEEGIQNEAFAAISFSGKLAMHSIVSQGCRPIGSPFVITGAKRNQILSIGRREALSVLEETFEELSEAERDEALGNVFAGLAATETVDEFATGHFLIRHIVSADLDEGRLMLDSPARIGQTLQFQMRDARAASRSLHKQLTAAKAICPEPFGALVFGGHERGRCFFGEESHDANQIRDTFGDIPLAGFFAHGEFGPIRGRAFRHDHSLCGILFSELRD